MSLSVELPVRLTHREKDKFWGESLRHRMMSRPTAHGLERMVEHKLLHYFLINCIMISSLIALWFSH